MEITQEQAWTIIGAIRTAEMEREDTDEDELLAVIRKNFPEIDAEMTMDELKGRLWSQESEKDIRVATARHEMEKAVEEANWGAPLFDPSRQRYEKLQKEFFMVKGLVFAELCAKAGLEIPVYPKEG